MIATSAAAIAAYKAEQLEAYRGLFEDALRRLQRYEESKLRSAAASRERLRDAVESLDAHRSAMADTLAPSMNVWLGWTSDVQGAARRAEVERVVAEYTEESARLVRGILHNPTDEPVTTTLDRLLATRWPERRARLVERFVRALEEL